MLGNHLPRQCGIATFTTASQRRARRASSPALDCFVLAMNDAGTRHAYPARVRFEIAEGDLASYRRAADFLNVNARRRASACSTSTASSAARPASHVLRAAARAAHADRHDAAHDPRPSRTRRSAASMDELARALGAARRDERARRRAAARGARRARPTRSTSSRTASRPCRRRPRSKDRLGVEGQHGHPDVRAALAGQGHRVRDRRAAGDPRALSRDASTSCSAPRIRTSRSAHGESLPPDARERARSGSASTASVIFHNRFVSQDELDRVPRRPPTSTSRRTSSPSRSPRARWPTRSASGKAVISTPYRYARELLADGRGVLVPWRDPGGDRARGRSSCSATTPSALALGARAAAHGRDMTWPAVARRYIESFERARARARRRGAGRRSRRRRSRSRPAEPARDQPRAPPRS